MEELLPVLLALKYVWENSWLESNLDGFWEDNSERKEKLAGKSGT